MHNKEKEEKREARIGWGELANPNVLGRIPA